MTEGSFCTTLVDDFSVERYIGGQLKLTSRHPSGVADGQFVKKILLALLLAATLCACDKEPAPSDLLGPDAALLDATPASPEFVGPCSVDTVWSGEPKETIHYTYDENVQIIREERDDKSDGVLDEIVERTYDQNGRMTALTKDLGADGTINYRAVFAYNLSGWLTTEEIDRTGDGVINARKYYTYDGEGKIRSMTYDANDDNEIDYKIEYVYDDWGNLKAEEVYTTGGNTPDEVNTYEYDSDGNLVEKREERTAGQSDQVFETDYVYDASGNLVEELIDYAADGSIDIVIRYSYVKSKLASKSIDKGNDGTDDEQHTFTYDDAGNLLSSELDRGADGTVEIATYNEYSCWE